MPIAKIESVIRVSSEDSLHPARNLALSAIGNNVKKWICQKKGEKQIYAIFKLKDKVNITHIVVGNENSAFLEILVGNEGSDEKEYKVFLPATEIQTLQDTRAGKNKNAIRFFKAQDFNKETLDGEWSRVKVVCSQPYDPHTRYGLSCFVVKSIKDETKESAKEAGEESEKKAVALSENAKKDLNDWKEDVLQRLAPGASTASSSSPPVSSSAAAAATPSSDKLKNDSSKLPNKSPFRNSAKEESKGSPKDSKKDTKKEKEKPKDDEAKPSTATPAPPTPPKREFRKLMDDVRFTMSGYENPLRSEIRNKALEMGARYAGDWDSRCTHLVCAFINTPKFNKVKGLGKIPTKDWIEECHRRRKRLPWRRFALDPRDRRQPVSEEDDSEEEKTRNQNKNQPGDRRRRLPSSSASDSDSEDEVQRVKARKATKLAQVDTAAAAVNGANVVPGKRGRKQKMTLEELYDADTDKEDDMDEDVDDEDADPDFDLRKQDPESELDLDADESFENEISDRSNTDFDDDDEPSPKKQRKTKKPATKKNEKRSDTMKMGETKKKNNGKLVYTKRNGDMSDDDDGERVSESKRPDVSGLPLPALPNVPPHTYYLAKDEKNGYRDNLTRYINAFGGSRKTDKIIRPYPHVFGKHCFYLACDQSVIAKERIRACIESFQWTIFDELTDEVEFVISDDCNVAKEIAKDHPDIVIVKSEWIWNCNDADRLLPTDGYTF